MASAKATAATMPRLLISSSATALLVLLADVTAAQAQAAGDLTRAAPYGIPPKIFIASTAHPVRQSAVLIPGYNVSAPQSSSAASGDGSAAAGWQLGVAVASNVPLTDATAPDTNTAQAIDATTLWLQPPASVDALDAASWRLCATVFPSVNMTAAGRLQEDNGPGYQNSGDCGPWLTDQCTAALNEAALAFGTSAVDGACANLTVPPTCDPYFMRGHGHGTAIGMLQGGWQFLFTAGPPPNSAELNEQILADGRFFAWGSAPTSRNDNHALDLALHHVWPVLMTWVQRDVGGGVVAANTHVSCVSAATNGTGTATERGTSGASASSVMASAVMACAGLAALLSVACGLLL